MPGKVMKRWNDLILITKDTDFDSFLDSCRERLAFRVRYEVHESNLEASSWPYGRTPGALAGNLMVLWNDQKIEVRRDNWTAAKAVLEADATAAVVMWFIVLPLAAEQESERISHVSEPNGEEPPPPYIAPREKTQVQPSAHKPSRSMRTPGCQLQ